MINHGIYGEYNVCVVKSGTNDKYYPFGTGYRKNIIVDDFFTKLLRDGYDHGSQAWMQTCITNTGTGIPTRFDTTGTFGVPNDVTWASTGFNYAFTAPNRTTMYRDFTFNVHPGPSPKIYREAMVGWFYTDRMTLENTYIDRAQDLHGDIAVSHFVFPDNVTIYPGDKLVVNYVLNWYIDYLSTGTAVSFTGASNGYNFDGTIRLAGDFYGIVGPIEMGPTYYRTHMSKKNVSTQTVNSISYTWFVYREGYQINANAYRGSYGGVPVRLNWFGGLKNSTARSYDMCGYYYGTGGAASNLPTYPTRYTGWAWVHQPFAQVTKMNFQLTESGGYVDQNYYLPAASFNRFVSGIILNRSSVETASSPTFALREVPTTMGSSVSNNFLHWDAVYLKFNTPQNILAFDAASIKIRWAINRL